MSSETGTGLRPINLRAYAGGMRLLDIIFRRYIKVSVDGQEHLPAPDRAMILAINHSSNLDAFVSGFALRRPAYFLAKVESTELPLVGRFLLSVGGIPAKRDKQDNKALRQMRQVLKEGHILGMTPEGTRSSDGRMLPFDPGFAWLAVRTGAQVVPMAVHGAHLLWAKGAKLPRRGQVWCRFGEPFDWSDEGRPDKDRLAEFAGEVRQRILDMLAELAEETGLPSPAVDASVEAIDSGDADA